MAYEYTAVLIHSSVLQIKSKSEVPIQIYFWENLLWVEKL